MVLNLSNRLFCVNLHDYRVIMKFRFVILVAAVVAMMFAAGCNDNDTKVESARTSIERYLTSSHSPRLIPKSEVENSIEYNPPFYERLSQDVYRYIATYYQSGRDSRREVAMGDVVELRVTAYTFSGSTPSLSAVYFTNEQTVLDQLAELGLDTQYWSSEPVIVKLGETNIIKGVELSLIGCRETDQVEVYMTSKAAYGNDALGVIKKESAIMWSYTIDKVY